MARSSTNVLVMALAMLGLASAAMGWQTGRATFYGTDAWSIHTGSCGFGHLAEDKSTGWNVAALSDVAPDYKGSCGKCKEIRCKNMNFRDGYGAELQRSSACFDQGASVVVMITDTCPCTYPGNAYSNKRWCCGDMYHLDISTWAFEKLADPKLGVIAIEWRDVSCKQAPTKAAKNPWGQKSTMHYQAPGGWNSNMDKRPEGNYLGRKMAL